MVSSNIIFGIVAGGAIIATAVTSAMYYFGPEILTWLSSLNRPSERDIKEQSAKMLAQMNKNVEERKQLARNNKLF